MNEKEHTSINQLYYETITFYGGICQPLLVGLHTDFMDRFCFVTWIKTSI